MSDRSIDRARELFDQAVELEPADRGAFLSDACLDDPTLLAEVESLLAFDAQFHDGTKDEGRLKSPLIRSSPETSGAFTAWTNQRFPTSSESRVGPYRIVRLIAEGGMGVVYEAEQDNPRRPVALKVVRPGMASDPLVERLGREAQILGRLQHPGIAQVYEAGIDDAGQPFFAMEYIRGLPLDEFARRRGMDLRGRFELIARVCEAVQHAHDRGVIHRDLKPANILVEETGQPRVLDFGVARFTDADLLTAAGLTRTGQLLGTPNYMSPEQVIADPQSIDRRTDIYALGVILFELAADRLPYRLENRPLAEAVRLILEQDPPLLGTIHTVLRGDVETIVARALEKDPARRYNSAAELGAELGRWLAHEPILARPPSTLYQLSKFARRHKTLVGGVVATMASLALGLVGMALFAVAEARQRLEAEHNAYRARVAAAAAALQNLDVADAARQLDAAPEGLRSWEWRHLQSRLDDSSARFPIKAGTDGYLLASKDRFRIGTWTDLGLRLSYPERDDPTTVPIGPQRGRLDNAFQTLRGLRVVVWTGNSTFNLLDEAGKVLCGAEMPGATKPCHVVMSLNGDRLASHCVDRGGDRVVVFDAASGMPSAFCDPHPGGIRGLCFSPDGSRLATVGGDRTARVWDASTGGAALAVCRGHSDKVLGVAFSPDGTRLATGSSDGTVRQWDVVTGKEIGSLYERHTGEVLSVAYSPDGQSIASTGTDRSIRVWRTEERQDVAILLGHTGAVTELAFDTSGRRLASLSSNSWLRYAGDDTIRVWDVDHRAALPIARGHTGPIYAVAYSPGGNRFASGSGDGSVRLWNASTGEIAAILPHPGAVWSLTFVPDGRSLATGTSADNRLRIWDVETARLRKEIAIPVGSLYFVVVSPDGQRVAGTGIDSQGKKYHFHVYDLASDERLFSADGWALAYSPNGRWLAALSDDEKTVLLLDAKTHETVGRFHGHEMDVFKVAFSQDSLYLASCSSDRTVRVWRIDNGDCRVLQGHSDEVQAVAFHPDGTRLASGGEDRTVWLWDLSRGDLVARLQGHKSFVWSLAFSPDGQSLISGSGDSTIRLWSTRPPETYDRLHLDTKVLPQ